MCLFSPFIAQTWLALGVHPSFSLQEVGACAAACDCFTGQASRPQRFGRRRRKLSHMRNGRTPFFIAPHMLQRPLRAGNSAGLALAPILQAIGGQCPHGRLADLVALEALQVQVRGRMHGLCQLDQLIAGRRHTTPADSTHE